VCVPACARVTGWVPLVCMCMCAHICMCVSALRGGGVCLPPPQSMWGAILGGVCVVSLAALVWLAVVVKGWAGKGVPGLHRYGFSEFKRLWVERGAQVRWCHWVGWGGGAAPRLTPLPQCPICARGPVLPPGRHPPGADAPPLPCRPRAQLEQSFSTLTHSRAWVLDAVLCAAATPCAARARCAPL
jgi:hypothetical protein